MHFFARKKDNCQVIFQKVIFYKQILQNYAIIIFYINRIKKNLF